MSKLKENIDRILGSSLRCLLPSYWWKRIFGLLVDEVEKKAPLSSFEYFKTKVEKAEKKVLDVYVPAPNSSLSFSYSGKNTDAWNKLAMITNGVIEEYNVRVHLVKDGIAYPLTPAFVEWHNWVLVVGVHEIEYSYPNTFNSNLYWNKIRVFGIDTDGNARLIESNAPNSSTIDSELSYESTNPVQNKVVTEAIKNVVPTFGITKTEGFAEYFLALTANQSNPNMYPRGIVLYEDSQSEVDNVISLNSRTDVGIEFSVADKRYRWVFNKASGMFIREEEVSSESSSGLPIYLCFDYGVGIISPPDMEREANKVAYNALQHLGSSALPYCILTIYKNGAKVGELSCGIEHYSTGTNLDFYTVDWDNGNKFDLLKYRLHEDGSVTHEGLVQADSELSDTSTNPVQSKVIKAYVDGAVSDIVQEIVKNEEVHAAALNDLNARIKELEERLKNAGL